MGASDQIAPAERATIIMPVHNGESTVGQALDSLAADRDYIAEVIVIDDGSKDRSSIILQESLKRSKIPYRLITHLAPVGLARSYNEGIRAARTSYVITMHQDVIITRGDVLKIIEVFDRDREAVIATHTVLHPREVWNQYNFWQKTYFSRLLEKRYVGVDGKFDGFRKADLEKVGLFDEKTFRTAGEDGDLVARLGKLGQTVDSGAEIIHLHKMHSSFTWRDIVKKQAQYSEAQGVLFRKGHMRSLRSIVAAFFREGLLFSLFVPLIWPLSFLATLAYALLYSKNMFKFEWRNPRVLLLPFLNFALLFISTLYSTRGLILGRQQI